MNLVSYEVEFERQLEVILLDPPDTPRCLLRRLGLDAVISLMASGFHVRAAERISTVETALLAALAGSIAIGRWGETASAPAVPAGALVIALLVPSIISCSSCS
jgi:hypothetical protein